MRFKMSYITMVYSLLGAVILIALASFVMNILSLAEVGRFYAINKTVPIVSLICCALLIAFCVLLLLNSAYVVKDDRLVIVFGLFSVSYSLLDILSVLEEKLTNKVYVQYVDKHRPKQEFYYACINVRSELNADFVKALLSKNPDIKHVVVDSLSSSDDTSDGGDCGNDF
jgi:hypothetical protein